MKILLVSQTVIPVYAYGGTERVIWDLGLALTQLGHEVSYLVLPGSQCDFARVIYIDSTKDLRQQIPDEIDIVHFQYKPEFDLDSDFDKKYIFTEHGNSIGNIQLPLNSVFVSRNHANRNGSNQFVHNGLNWNAYGKVNFDQPRTHHHFLGKAAWRVKNVAGAIDVALSARVKLAVLGGTRLNLKRGFRYTWSRKIEFHGMVGGTQKFSLLNKSNGLIFPVRWNEPFGLAIIESLYFGCPVFATPYGSLPELISEEYGYLSSSQASLFYNVINLKFEPKDCHQYAVNFFSSTRMAEDYINKYEKILDDEKLNMNKPTSAPIENRLKWNNKN